MIIVYHSFNMARHSHAAWSLLLFLLGGEEEEEEEQEKEDGHGATKQNFPQSQFLLSQLMKL